MALYDLLKERQAGDKPICIGVIGAGKFGSMFLSQAIRIPGIHVIGVADLDIEQAKSNLANVHWEKERYSAASLDDAAKTLERISMTRCDLCLKRAHPSWAHAL